MSLLGAAFQSFEDIGKIANGNASDTSEYFTIGDHLMSPRFGYSHHGLYIGQGLVIHYSGFARDMQSGAIEVARLEEFADGCDVSVVPHFSRKFSRPESVERAYGRLGEDWYNLLLNNCEHFVHWCIDGWHESPQVSTATTHLASAGAIAYLHQNPAARRLILEKIRQLSSNTVFEKTFGQAASTVFNTSLNASTAIGSSFAMSSASALASSASHSSSVVGLVAGVGGGAAAYATGTGAATAAVTGFVGAGAAAVSTTVALPLAAAVGAGYLAKKVWDWW